MINKKKNTFSYLFKSFFNAIQQEGFKNAAVRFLYFARYGKGVTSKNDYDRFRKEQKMNPVSLYCIQNFFDLKCKNDATDVKECIDIIIPFYNGFQYLDPLFKSIVNNTDSPYRLIIVDDASSDKKINTFLVNFQKMNSNLDITLIKNDENLGFVKTINRAVKETKNHFVLLNTDTEVPPGWLRRLMHPIISLERVASTTPMTNAGTIFSFPHFLEDNEIFGNLDVNTIDAYFKRVNLQELIEVPTGMGFCMGFNKNIVDQIGMFDEEVFGKGYGEENDWSQRAINAGYRNIAVPNLFVYHKHGGSFSGAEKKELIEKNLQQLNQKHPQYNSDVQEFIKNDSLKEMRDFLAWIIFVNEINTRKVTFIFDHELGGGANLYTKHFVTECLSEAKVVIVFTYKMSTDMYYARIYFDEYEIGYEMENANEVMWLLQYCDLGEVIVSQIVSYKDPLEVLNFISDISQKNNAKITFLTHDYFCICPSYNLLNQKNQYCAVPTDLKVCEQCLVENKGQFRTYTQESDIVRWRYAWENFFKTVETIFCFSQTSADIFMKAYPNINKEKIKVKPHRITYINRLPQINKNNNTITIGVLGGINLVKGAKIVGEMAELIEKNKLNMKIVVIGSYFEKKFNKHLVVHGKYVHDEIVDLTEKYEIDVFFIPSIWPETFAYTAEEIMQMQMPLTVFNLGAPAERAQHYEKGIIIDEISAQSVIDSIIKALSLDRQSM